MRLQSLLEHDLAFTGILFALGVILRVPKSRQGRRYGKVLLAQWRLLCIQQAAAMCWHTATRQQASGWHDGASTAATGMAAHLHIVACQRHVEHGAAVDLRLVPAQPEVSLVSEDPPSPAVVRVARIEPAAVNMQRQNAHTAPCPRLTMCAVPVEHPVQGCRPDMRHPPPGFPT